MKPIFALALFAVGTCAFGQSITLHEALAVGRENRLTIVAARDALAAARAATSAMAAGPSIVVGAGGTSRAGLGATDQDLFVAYAPDLFGRTKANRSIAEAGFQRLLADQRQAWLDVQNDVLAAYIEAYAAGRQAATSDGLLEVADALYAATQRRFEEGKVPEVQLALARLERDRTQQRTLQLKAKQQAALNRLAAAMGVSDPPLSVARPELAPPEARVEQRPDVMALVADARAAEAEAVVAAKESAPDLELTALRSPWSDPVSQFAVRAQLTWRIGDFGKTRASVQAAQQRARALHARVADLTQGALGELHANALEVDAAKVRLESATAIRQAAADLAAKSQRGFAEGYGTLLDVLEAVRALRDLELEVVDVEREYFEAIAARYAAAGALIEVRA